MVYLGDCHDSGLTLRRCLALCFLQPRLGYDGISMILKGIPRIPRWRINACRHEGFHFPLRMVCNKASWNRKSNHVSQRRNEKSKQRNKKATSGWQRLPVCSFISAANCARRYNWPFPAFFLFSSVANPHLLLPSIISADITPHQHVCGEKGVHGEMHYWTVSGAKNRNSGVRLQHKCQAGESLKIERSSITDTMDRQGVIIHRYLLTAFSAWSAANVTVGLHCGLQIGWGENNRLNLGGSHPEKSRV